MFKILYTMFIRIYWCKIGKQFNSTSVLVAEQSNYATKTVNAYIIYGLDYWPKIPLDNIMLKRNCFFGVTNIVENSDNSKCMYIGFKIVFDGLGSWHFGNGFARKL